jgi:hypothetical protein
VTYKWGCVGDFYTTFDYMLRVAYEHKYSYEIFIDSMEMTKLRNRHLEIIGNSPLRFTVENHLGFKK